MGDSAEESEIAVREQRCDLQLGECGRFSFTSAHKRPDGTVCEVEHDKRDSTEDGRKRLEQFVHRQFVIDLFDKRNEPSSLYVYGTCSACTARLYAIRGVSIRS